MCLCVCLSVGPALLVNKIPAEQKDLNAVFAKWLLTGSNTIEIGDLGLKVKVTVT